jgi:hypothetical protein
MGRVVDTVIGGGFGALDAAVASKAGVGPGGFPWSLYLELGGAALGLVGGKVGISGEHRDPLFISSVTLLGRRAAMYGMKGALFNPKGWAAIGGEGGWGGDGDASTQFTQGGAGGAPRLLPGRGGYPLFPAMTEAAGIAG